MQDFFRRTFNDVSLKITVSNAVSKATDASNFSLNPADARVVFDLTVEHPKMTIAAIRGKFNPAKAASAHLALLLFEDCVNGGNSQLHDTLEADTETQEALVNLAIKRGADMSAIQLQRTARRVVLEVSRMFEATGAHPRLAGLAARFEAATGKQLLRAVVTENRRVRVSDPTPDSYRFITPIKREPRSNIRQRAGSAPPQQAPQSAPAAAAGQHPQTAQRQRAASAGSASEPSRTVVAAVAVDDESTSAASEYVSGTVVSAEAGNTTAAVATVIQGSACEAADTDVAAATVIQAAPVDPLPSIGDEPVASSAVCETEQPGDRDVVKSSPEGTTDAVEPDVTLSAVSAASDAAETVEAAEADAAENVEAAEGDADDEPVTSTDDASKEAADAAGSKKGKKGKKRGGRR